MYRLHSMFGPTVMAYKTLTEALEALDRKKLSNGGLYRIIKDGSEKVLASLDTYATTSILQAEMNARYFEKEGTKT